MARKRRDDRWSEDVLARVRQGVLDWFEPRRTAYPWRGERDLWRALVAELMLHQTQMSRALPAYERFVERYPAPEDFAGAHDDAVRDAWRGLGYYRRAFYLRDAARALAGADEPPRTVEELLELSGVGPYTAALLASTVYGEPVAAVDGNVTRVVARLFDIGGEPERAAFRREVGKAAQRIIDPRRPGDWNEALMDLGRDVCSPRDPACPACPLASHCVARARGRQENVPRPRRRDRRDVHVAIGVVRSPSGVLVVRRPSDGLLARQIAFPTAEGDTPEAARVALDERLRRLVGVASGGRPAGGDEHTFTHRVWRTRVWRYTVDGAAHGDPEVRWVAADDLQNEPLPSLYARIARRCVVDASRDAP